MPLNTLHRFHDLFSVTHYPSGEFHVALRPNVYSPGNHINILADDIRDFNGLGCLVSANDILSRLRCEPKWFVPFFPFARDDRRNTSNDGFELGMAIKMVEHMDITILDPHSDVAGMLKHIPQEVVVGHWQQCWGLWGEKVCFIIPDAGAIKKANKFIGSNPSVVCHKTRDTATGKLSGFGITSGEEHILGAHCVIVDDICDGGGTFMGLAKIIRQHKPAQLDLVVTHGLFTRGINDLLGIFDQLYTTGKQPHCFPLFHTIPHEVIWKGEGRP